MTQQITAEPPSSGHTHTPHGRHNARSATTDAGAAPGARRTARSVLGLALGLTAVISVMLIAFALPGAKSGAHEVPIGISAPTATVKALTTQLNSTRADAFAVTTYPDADALSQAIRDRNVYGGIAVGADGAQVLTASAGSPAIATSLDALVTPLEQSTHHAVTVEDLVAPPATDPRGAGLAGAGLALTASGMTPAILASSSFRKRPWVGLGAATLAAAGIGTAVSVLLHSPFDTLNSAVGPVAAGLALGSIALSWFLLGLDRVLGSIALYAGAAVMMLLGISLSGLSSAPELLPAGWGALGQLLPPGANATLLRSTGYFGGAGASHALTVLCSWVGAGLVLMLLGGLRQAHRTRPEAAGASTDDAGTLILTNA